MRRRGKFITFEGPEGSGKSTQSKSLCDFLRRRGFKVLHTREPGGTRISERIRKVLLDGAQAEMTDACELFLFLACRAQLVEERIIPALKRGYVVVCDRFHDATVAYQGYGAGLDMSVIEKAGRLARKGLKPDLTILLDVAAQEGLKRAGFKDRIERKPRVFHRRVRSGYLALARKEPERIITLSGKGGIKKIQDEIRKAALDVL